MRRTGPGLVVALFFALPVTGQEMGLGAWSTPAETGEKAAPAFEPEKQVATGKFLTALEIRPIMEATKSNWVAVREWEGQDLVYFTHILSWRCGLHSIHYAINGGEERRFEAEPCHVDTNTPNALAVEAFLPYIALPPNSVQQVSVRLVYDDATETEASYDRADVLMH